MDDKNPNDQDIVEEQNPITSEEPIVDGEVVSSDVPAASSSSQSEVMILESLESLIRENLARVDKLQIEANQQKEMVDSVLLNDEVYKQHEEAVKDAQKIKNGTKSEIIKRPDVAHVVEKLKDLKLEIKEIRESMASYLQEYVRLSGSTEIENDRGEVMQIINVAKLVKRRA